jgi:hypothetical protein
MNPDLSKLILHTGYNSFKNVNSYPGSITFPASVPPATPSVPFSQTIVNVTLSDNPVFTMAFANFTELVDGLFGTVKPHWYQMEVASGTYSGNIAYYDIPFGGAALPGTLYQQINGNVITLTASVFNSTAHTYVASLTVPFIFIEYTLAN